MCAGRLARRACSALVQASTNSGIAASAASGLAPRIAQPSATAARIGTATSARSVSPVAVSDTYRIAKITTTIEPIGTSAHPRPRNRSSHATRAIGRGAATTPACTASMRGVRRYERERHARQSTWRF